MKIFRTAGLTAAAGVLGTAAMAQQADNANADTDPALETITITAAPLDDVLQPADVLSGEELQLKTATSIGETLAYELGVSSSYFGPAASRPIIRGLSGSRVTVVTDSISTLDVSDVSPDHAVTVEPLLADQIEIIRGPSTLLYGSSAAGGVVNVVDSRIHEVPWEKTLSGGFEMRGDTAANERAFVGRLDGGLGALSWHLDGFTRETDNIDIDGFATAHEDERDEDEREGTLANSYSESDGFAGGLSLAGERGYIGVAFSRNDSTYGLPGGHEHEHEEEGHDEDEHEDEHEEEEAIFEGPFIDLEQTRVDLRGGYRFADGFLESAKLSFGVNDYEHNEIEPSGEIGTNFNNDAWQARAEVIHSAVAGWRGAVGVQVDDRDFAAVGEEAFIAPATTESVGVFLVEERDFEWGHLHFGARIDATEHISTEFAGYDEDAFSFSAGFVRSLSDFSELTFNVSRTERHANAEELYSNGAHLATGQFEIGLLADGQTGAVTEDSLNLELGVGGDSGSFDWELSVYYNDIGDYIYQQLTGEEEDELPVARFAQDDAEFFGYEAAVSFDPLQSERFTSRLRIFADHVEADLENGDELPRLPPLRAGVNFELGQDAWQAGLDAVYHASRDDITSFPTDSFTMLNASFLYRLNAGATNLSLFARGTNLLDEAARRSTSFLAETAPLPGRSFHFGLRARF